MASTAQAQTDDQTTLPEVTVSASGLQLGVSDLTQPVSILEGDTLVRRREATLGETLLPGFEAATWYGIYAPKGTPAAIIEKLHAAYNRALADPSWTAAMSATGIRVLPADQRTPAALAAHTQAEVQRWAAVLGQAGVAKQ